MSLIQRLAQRLAESANSSQSEPPIVLMRALDRESDRLGLTREQHLRILVEVTQSESLSLSF